MQRVTEAAREAKKELSSLDTAHVNLPFLAQGPSGPLHLEATLTRAAFNDMTRDLVERTSGPVQTALNDAGIAASELGCVLLVGGSTPFRPFRTMCASSRARKRSASINPDECVAMGAAIQGATLSGTSTGLVKADNSILLLDVTPLSLSIETVGGVRRRLVERNTTLPVHYSQVFSTAAAFQTSVEIHVLQGERPMAKDNKSIGTFKLKGIKRAPAGVPQIEVTFDIDANDDRVGEGSGHGQGAVHHHRLLRPHVRRRHRARHSRCRAVRRAGQRATRGHAGARRRRRVCSTRWTGRSARLESSWRKTRRSRSRPTPTNAAQGAVEAPRRFRQEGARGRGGVG